MDAAVHRVSMLPKYTVHVIEMHEHACDFKEW